MAKLLLLIQNLSLLIYRKNFTSSSVLISRMSRSLDENLDWCLAHSRWTSDDSRAHIKKEVFDSMPLPLKSIIPIIARKGVISALKKQRSGSHSDEEIIIVAQRMFSALSTILNQKPCSSLGKHQAHLMQLHLGF